MVLNEREYFIPINRSQLDLLSYLSREVQARLAETEIPVRFVVTISGEKGYHCELGILSDIDRSRIPSNSCIFDFNKRVSENVTQFNAVLVIPTGIGAEIGGHSGDAGPVARLLAASCDNLILHPNVVNAADINEYPENSLYVEGSVLSRLLMGTVGLQKVRANRVMLIINDHPDMFIQEAAINSASAARAAFGLDCPGVVRLNSNLIMRSLYSSSGRAVGRVEYFEQLYILLEKYRKQYDAIALSSNIQVPEKSHTDYFRRDLPDMVNPWGGVEAMLTHAISLLFDVPSAHSPMVESRDILNLDVGVVDPRKAAEAISTTYLHCILKGLHRSPRIINYPLIDKHPGLITVSDISCLVIPDGCIGLPTLAALEQGIPVIAVKRNQNRMQNNLNNLPFSDGKLYWADNYLEAVGIMNCIKVGVATSAVRRPILDTKVHDYCQLSEPEDIETIINDDFSHC